MSVAVLNDENFKEFISKDELVLVDFWAPWCGPCKMIGPIIEKLSNEGFITAGKVNVDDVDLVPSAFNIESIPTLMLFKGGKLISKAVGFQPENAIKNWILNNK